MTIERACEIVKGFPKSVRNSSWELTGDGYTAFATIAKALSEGYKLVKEEK